MAAVCIAKYLPNFTYPIPSSLPTQQVHHLPLPALELPENTMSEKETFTQESAVLHAFLQRISKQFSCHRPHVAGGGDHSVN